MVSAIRSRLDEFTDGYLVVAFTVDQQPILFGNAKDPKTALALNSLLVDIVQRGGISVKTADQE